MGQNSSADWVATPLSITIIIPKLYFSLYSLLYSLDYLLVGVIMQCNTCIKTTISIASSAASYTSITHPSLTKNYDSIQIYTTAAFGVISTKLHLRSNRQRTKLH